MFISRQLPLLTNSTKRAVTCHGRLCSHIPNNNDEVLADFVNRNPRSMELLRIARKPRGYTLDVPTVCYYYRLNLQSTKYLTAFVEHNNGSVVVSASTKEWGIRKQLFSAKDAAAAQNLGRILARRCLQSGIMEVHTELEASRETSTKVKLFLEAMEEEGITLEEDPQIREQHTYVTTNKIATLPWEVTEDDVDAIDKRFSPSDLQKDEFSPPR